MLANGIDTVPLDIVLSPWSQENILLFSEFPILSVNYKCKIQNENTTFFSLHSLLCMNIEKQYFITTLLMLKRF